MNSAVINIRTEPEIKREAQKVVKNLGLSLSDVMNGYLRELVKVKKVNFSAAEAPSAYLVKQIELARSELADGGGSPVFNNTDKAIKWLKGGKSRKYAGKV